MNILITIILSLLFCSCSHKKTDVKNSKTHTMKLRKSLSVKFKNIHLVSVTLSSETLDASIEIIGVDEEDNKTRIFEADVSNSLEISIDASKNLKTYKLIVSTLKAKDLYGNEISDVAIYRVSEQESINKAKDNIKTINK